MRIAYDEKHFKSMLSFWSCMFLDAQEWVGFTATNQMFRDPWLSEPGCPHPASWAIKHLGWFYLFWRGGAKLCKTKWKKTSLGKITMYSKFLRLLIVLVAYVLSQPFIPNAPWLRSTEWCSLIIDQFINALPYFRICQLHHLCKPVTFAILSLLCFLDKNGKFSQ